MKTKISLSLLLIIAILSITHGSHFLPFWAWTIVLLFSLVLSFLITLKVYESDKKSTDLFRAEVLKVISEQSEKLLSNIEQSKTDTLHRLDKIQNEILSVISANSESLKKNTEQSAVIVSEKTAKSILELSSKIVEYKKGIERSNAELKEIIHGKTTQLQETFVATVSATKDSVVDKIKKVDDSQNKALAHLSDDFASKLNASQQSIEHSVTEVTSRVDAIKESNEELKAQSSELMSIVKNSIDESSNATEVFLDEVKEHAIQTNQLLSTIQITVENVESGVSAMFSKNEEQTITESVKNIIAEFKKELLSSLSSVNNSILDTQIAQETASDELRKLQELLRVLSLPAISQSAGIEDLSSNRIESIVDPETHNEVLNQYDGGKLSKSSMKDANGHLVYDVEYKAGVVARTRNYNSEGKLNIEQTFFENGQVHYRTEYTSTGKKTTEFDINGNKK